MSGVIPSAAGSELADLVDRLIAAAMPPIAETILAAGAKCDELWPAEYAQDARYRASCRSTVIKHEAATAVAVNDAFPERVRNVAAYVANWAYSCQAIWQVECEKKWAADPTSHPSVRLAAERAAKEAERAAKDAENDAYWAEHNSAEAVAERERDRLAVQAQEAAFIAAAVIRSA